MMYGLTLKFLKPTQKYMSVLIILDFLIIFNICRKNNANRLFSLKLSNVKRLLVKKNLLGCLTDS